MKSLLLILSTLLFVGCVTTPEAPSTPAQPDQPTAVVDSPHSHTPPVEEPAVEVPPVELAWGLAHPEWDKALFAEIKKHDWSGIKMPCSRVSAEVCVAQWASITTYYESTWKPEEKYEECSDKKSTYTDATYVPSKKKYCMMSGGEIVTSRGLAQISKDSANSSRYKCGITDSKQLHDPIINLQCMIKIAHYNSKKFGVLLNGTKESGGGAYWAVNRQYKFVNGVKVEKTSYKGIKAHTDKY